MENEQKTWKITIHAQQTRMESKRGAWMGNCAFLNWFRSEKDRTTNISGPNQGFPCISKQTKNMETAQKKHGNHTKNMEIYKNMENRNRRSADKNGVETCRLEGIS